jgi:hypothetical protein
MTEKYWLELAATALADTALTTRFSEGHSACAAVPEVRLATGFAAWKHTGHFRKGEGKTPYIHHPVEVAAILSEAGAVADNDLLQAALLHDTIEDTETEREEIESHFGLRICSIVVEVTDDKSLKKQERKAARILVRKHMQPIAADTLFHPCNDSPLAIRWIERYRRLIGRPANIDIIERPGSIYLRTPVRKTDLPKFSMRTIDVFSAVVMPPAI